SPVLIASISTWTPRGPRSMSDVGLACATRSGTVVASCGRHAAVAPSKASNGTQRGRARDAARSSSVGPPAPTRCRHAAVVRAMPRRYSLRPLRPAWPRPVQRDRFERSGARRRPPSPLGFEPAPGQPFPRAVAVCRIEAWGGRRWCAKLSALVGLERTQRVAANPDVAPESLGLLPHEYCVLSRIDRVLTVGEVIAMSGLRGGDAERI